MKLRGSLLSILLLLPASAFGDEPVSYADGHPVAPEAGGGYCPLAGVHEHDYAPPEELSHLFRDCEGSFCFVGDPVPFGYGGAVVAYEGHHPLSVPPDGSFCYLFGLHYHVFYPQVVVLPYYVLYAGVLVWRGPVGPVYRRDRVRYERRTQTYTTLPADRATAKQAERYYTRAWRTELMRLNGRLRIPGVGAGRAGFAGRRAAAAPVRSAYLPARSAGRRR
jgi:hypothetical protein